MLTRHFVQIDGLALHYRECNRDTATGTPLVMLHPSPMSSIVFEPAMAMFPATQHVIALDTPGYGLSQAPVNPATKIADYLPVLKGFIDAVAGERTMLYGSATGAQLALGYANAHPSGISHLFLDNAAHFDDDTREAIFERYFIDITPTTDGAHLSPLWQMCRQMLLYFPWFEAKDMHRIRQGEPSAAEIQALMIHFLAAGPRYAEAYAAAFNHERVEHYQSLTVPTTLFRWLGSPLLAQIDELRRYPLPACVRCVETPVSMVERYRAMVQEISALT